MSRVLPAADYNTVNLFDGTKNTKEDVMASFHGSIVELKSLVKNAGFQGVWSDNAKSNSHQFKSQSGEILNWWPTKGTLQFQGKNREAFESSLSANINSSPSTPKSSDKPIFIVHGHDKDTREALELVLYKLGAKSLVLQDTVNGGRTLVECLEKRMCQESALGIILMTPDDFGYSQKVDQTERQPRARQNVILEMGMVMAALGRDEMLVLKKGALEMPSDVAGVQLHEFNGPIREVVPKLASWLISKGFSITPDDIAKATS